MIGDELEKLAAAVAILVVVAAAFWSYLVVTYESELGTSNVVQVDLTDSCFKFRNRQPTCFSRLQ